MNAGLVLADTPVFAPATSLSTQTAPVTVVTADFNGNGKLDAAALNRVGASVTIFDGNGTGGSTGSTTLPCGGIPSTLSVADLNRDGRPDLIVGMGVAGSILLFTNTATGFSNPPTEINLQAANIVAVAVADLNRDGWTDLVAIDGVDKVTAVLSAGSGTFATPTTYTDPNPNRSPRDIVLADVNADGDLDLVIANGAGSVRVLSNDGAGSFASTPAIYNTLPNLPNTVALSDLNGDGSADIVTGGSDSGAGSLASLFNNGDGTFKSATTYSLAAIVDRLLFADVSRDGRPELVMAGAAADQVTVVEVAGTAGTNPVMELLPAANFIVGDAPAGLAVADLDGDGRLDIFTANQAADTVSILHNISVNTNKGTFLPSTQYYPTGGPSLFGLASGDFDADGKVDLAAADFSQFSPAVRFYYNQGGFFPPAPTIVATNTSFAAFLATGDFDRDGWLDVVASMGGDPANPRPAKVILHPADGATLSAVAVPSAGKIFKGDFNRDGILDLGFSGEGTSVTISFGIGDGTFAYNGEYTVGADAGLSVVGDVNSDGADDIIVPIFSENTFEVLLNDGQGAFTNNGAFATGKGPHQAVAGDFNQDGKLDAAVVNAITNNVSVFLGDGTGHFAAKKDYPVGLGPLGITVGDLNSDGKLDLATANTNTFKNDSGGTVSILYGQAGGLFAKKVDYVTSTGSGPAQIVAADLDNDGQVDLATANLRGGNVSVLLHTGAPLPKASNFKVTIPTGARDASQWVFQVDQPSTAPGVTVEIQGATSLAKNADWITLTGTWVRNGSTWTLTATNIPSGPKVYFRVVTKATGYSSDIFKVTSPKYVAVLGIPKMKSFSVSTVSPTKTGQPWTFQAVQPLDPEKKDKNGVLLYPNLKIRVQSTETPAIEGSWTDLPYDGIKSGGVLYQLGANWTRTTGNIPEGDQYFRAICSADGLKDDVSPAQGPFNVREAPAPTLFTHFLLPDPSLPIRTGQTIPLRMGISDENGLQSVRLEFSYDNKKWTESAAGPMQTTGDGFYFHNNTYFGSAGQSYQYPYVYLRLAATDNDTPANTTYSEVLPIRIGTGDGAAPPTFGAFFNYPVSGSNILTHGSLKIEIPIGDDKQVRDAYLVQCESNGDFISFQLDADGDPIKMIPAKSGNLAYRSHFIENLPDGTYYFRVLVDDFDNTASASPVTGPFYVFTPPPPPVVVIPTVSLTVRANSRLVGPSGVQTNKNHVRMQRPDPGKVYLDYSGFPPKGIIKLISEVGETEVITTRAVSSSAGTEVFDKDFTEPGRYRFEAFGAAGDLKGKPLPLSDSATAEFQVGHSWNKADTFTKLDYGLYWFKDVKNGLKAIPGQDDEYFSPSRPTVIYVHGWQASEVNIRRRESWKRYVTDSGTTSVDLAAPWKAKGYNVGIFYWNQFGSEEYNGLYRVESKIYGTRGPDNNETAGVGMAYTLSTDVKKKTFEYLWNSDFQNVNVADLFYTDYTANFLNYSTAGKDLRLIGHSLGTQVIGRTMALVETYRPANVPLPTRMAFLDPAYVKTEHRNKQPGYFSQLAAAGVALEIYQSTNLQSILGHPSATFDQAAYQRIVPNWAGAVPDSHGEPIRWYSLSFQDGPFTANHHTEPPVYYYSILGRGDFRGWALSAGSSIDRVKEHMAGGARHSTYFVQIEGTDSPKDGKGGPGIDDDTFEERYR